jgi:hypothetical protein
MKGMKTGGRLKGTPNKTTAEVKALAMTYAPAAIEELARLAASAESEQVRVQACSILLDRACGKPVQPLANDADNPFASLMDMIYGQSVGVPGSGEPVFPDGLDEHDPRH